MAPAHLLRSVVALVMLVTVCLPSVAADGVDAQVGGAKALESGAGQVGNVWNFPEYVAACMKIDGIFKRNLADLRLLRQFDQALGWVGPAIGLTEAAALAAQGRDIDALIKAGQVSADVAVCSSKPMLCPAWAVGRTMGSVIDGLVKLSRADKKSLQELLEDEYVERLYERPANARELLQLQTSIARAKARREAREREMLRCEDPRQTRQGVDTLLRAAAATRPAGASAPAPLRSTPKVGCEILDDIRATERMAAEDPDAYDALRDKCLGS
jgi:hypothetical protein